MRLPKWGLLLTAAPLVGCCIAALLLLHYLNPLIIQATRLLWENAPPPSVYYMEVIEKHDDLNIRWLVVVSDGETVIHVFAPVDAETPRENNQVAGDILALVAQQKLFGEDGPTIEEIFDVAEAQCPAGINKIKRCSFNRDSEFSHLSKVEVEDWLEIEVARFERCEKGESCPPE